jgi:hypothetical protein
LRANLANDAVLAFDFELQFLGIDDDERLTLFDGIADVGEDLRDAPFDLGADGAFFEREKRAGGLHAALGGFFRYGIDVHRCRMSGVTEDVGGRHLATATNENNTAKE